MYNKNKYMTPIEKAEELYNKMLKYTFCPEYADERDLGLEQGTFTKEGEWERFCAKQCALIAVDEILEANELNYLFTQEEINCLEGTSDDRWIYETYMKYWNEVKNQINLLK